MFLLLLGQLPPFSFHTSFQAAVCNAIQMVSGGIKEKPTRLADLLEQQGMTQAQLYSSGCSLDLWEQVHKDFLQQKGQFFRSRFWGNPNKHPFPPFSSKTEAVLQLPLKEHDTELICKQTSVWLHYLRLRAAFQQPCAASSHPLGHY